ncbi:MAG: PadR family transcriptional regulator [Gemmatimonadetes bacterium]|nr:PadR family transcriptional regulator [Gemmatimonadota bacterium]NNL29899.1 PadR family transcriptional regulator [Gemmatimonadota bacterium]
MTDSAIEQLLPLKAVDFHILWVLSEGDLHGYGLVKEIEARSDGHVMLEPGNLYRYVRRLVDEGLVEPGDREAARTTGRRRRYYRATALGRKVLAAETARMRSVVDAVDMSLGSEV